MLKFVGTPQAMPDKRPPAERRRDFDEIYANYAREKAAEQSARCSQCGVPFCQIHCPLHNNIPDWLKLTAEGRLEEAYELSSATNNFPEICGRICPQDRLCEGNCVIEKGFEAVTIGSVEKFITDTAWAQGWVKPIQPRRERRESVGIVGAGPAGLAAAEQLRRKGYQVAIYDRYDRVGGLLIYGIPNFKLEKEIVQRRETLLRDFEGHLPSRVRGRPRRLAGRAARPPRRRADGVGRLPGARHRRPRRRPARHRRGARLSHRLQPQWTGRQRARLRLGRARCQGQARRGDRRRRHGDGLRAHRRAPGRQVGEVPLSPRPRQHAGLAARGEARRGGRRRVRLALRAAGLSGQGESEPRALRAHPSRHARFDRPADAAGDSQQPRQHRGRPGAEGAGLRSRGSAGDARRRPISASPAGAR